MESENPAQLPVVQETQAHPPAGQPIMYQMAPGQQQPVFIQVPTGQPTTTPEAQPIQYYYVPVGQPAQPAQPGQPGQPVFVQGAPGQHVQSGQPVFIQGAAGQPMQPQQQAGQGGFGLNINTEFLKSPPCYIKIAEFVTLLGAWASILKYLDRAVEDEKADFFKGIMIFSWVVVILYLIVYILSVPKMCNCKRPSLFTITSVVFYFILFTLLLACTGNLVPRAVDLGEHLKLPPSAYKDKVMSYIIALYVALAFGFISCFLFVVDMVLNNRLFQTQRAQEIPSDQQLGHPVTQQPGVVIMPQNLAQGGKQQVFQSLAHPGQQPFQYPEEQPVQYPGQQPVQYPGQQPVVIGMPPPGFCQQPQQDPSQK